MSGGNGDDCEGPPQIDATGLCGNEVVPVVQEKPNLYFVLDASGSMSALMPGGGTRLSVAKSAMTNVLHEIGHRVRYGLATYPGAGVDSCATGLEIFETQEGDPVQCVNKRVAGPVLGAFASKLSLVGALGGTPISATLKELTPTITGLPGETFVVLLTDGAPNCSYEAVCGVDDCMPNIERMIDPNDRECNDEYNCCDAAQTENPFAPTYCVDRVGTVGAVETLAQAGVKTFVIGVPGSEFYADLLDQLAHAGGTARIGEERAYYKVSDAGSLSAAMKQIGVSVATSCDITLQQASRIDPKTINVYFDATIVPSDGENGWTFQGDAVTIHGSFCEQLLAGEVVQIQVVAGCPTIIR